MNAITIPKEVTRGDELIVIPRRDYEEFLRIKNGSTGLKIKRSLRVAKKHEKFYDGLDKQLSKSLASYERGNYEGPFDSVEELKKALEK